MKKGLFIMLTIVSTLVMSCSKDAKINRRIDGEWKVLTIGGQSLESSESATFEFDKDGRKEGDGTLTWVNSLGTTTNAFTYSVADQKITLTLDGAAEILNVTKYEKANLQFNDIDGDVWVCEPK